MRLKNKVRAHLLKEYPTNDDRIGGLNMLCQRCNQKDANVHITKVINGVKTELHLCDECAKQSEDVNMNFAI
ncbi:MAG: hypothetical protein KatS3mg079_324 [Caloramator sp.]|nr:MAG: hypothetical protein KatS3mg079_324 [Caloramator sp.]